MRAILVIGPEGSGTRLTAKFLLARGFYGNAGHVQRLDAAGAIAKAPIPFMLRRSVPHGGHWPPLLELLAEMDARAGEATGVIVTVREYRALIGAQLRAHHVSTEAEAEAHIRRAWREMAPVVASERPVLVLPYEALVLHPKAVQSAISRWATNVTLLDAYIAISDEDNKYY